MIYHFVHFYVFLIYESTRIGLTLRLQNWKLQFKKQLRFVISIFSIVLQLSDNLLKVTLFI